VLNEQMRVHMMNSKGNSAMAMGVGLEASHENTLRGAQHPGHAIRVSGQSDGN